MAARRVLVTFGLAVLLFFVGFVIHEGLHLAVIRLVGAQASLVVRPWRFNYLPLTLPSVHAQPLPPLDFDRQLAVNFFGPAPAALIFMAAMFWVRDRRWSLALAANAAVLVFYALIEAGSLIAEAHGVDPGVLEMEEFNYGVPLLLLVLAALLAAAGRYPPAAVTSMSVTKPAPRPISTPE